MLWHLGNTTVRTPYRLRDALLAIHGTTFNGNIIGRVRENEFAAHLHDLGVLNSPRVENGEDASDLGRKWRAALSQLGFITPTLTRRANAGSRDPKLTEITDRIEGLSDRPFEITPNGMRLMNCELLTAQQECFLRALVSYRIPSILETRYDAEAFSPLRHVLKVFGCITEQGGEAKLSFQEFALLVQTSTPADGAANIAESILTFREGRRAAAGNVRAYDRHYYDRVASELDKSPDTLDDYADLSFRYLKATGLFRNAGRGLALNPIKYQLCELLKEEVEQPLNNDAYLIQLWQGAELPTDNVEASAIVVQDLSDRLHGRGEEVVQPPAGAELRELEHLRFDLENRLVQLDEQAFADDQVNRLDEISAWMDAIPSRGSATLPNGDRVIIPKGEGPAYLEWVIWRAFLAINSLSNKVWEARRFQIDQDFLPVHCAPRGGPDMIFEFEDVIIVVEVTLTASSRQEAAEGEPVRRHVANIAEDTDKEVFGLFVALQIDSNTAHTFRSGDWYRPDDSKMSLQIVPMTLSDFQTLFESGKGRFNQMPALLRQVMLECRSRANEDAPVWKETINQVIGWHSQRKTT